MMDVSLLELKQKQQQFCQLRRETVQQQPKQIVVDGYTFNRDDNTGYYLSTCKILLNKQNKRWRLHVYQWVKEYGEIPKGLQLHHIDGDKSNNCVTNLQILTVNTHLSHHGQSLSIEKKQLHKEMLQVYAQPKAKLWHSSEEGRQWHSQNGKEIWAKRTIESYTCAVCGKGFQSKKRGNVRFCSNNCKVQARRLSGVDDENRICLRCGQVFRINKYSKQQYCSRKCGVKRGLSDVS